MTVTDLVNAGFKVLDLMKNFGKDTRYRDREKSLQNRLDANGVCCKDSDRIYSPEELMKMGKDQFLWWFVIPRRWKYAKKDTVVFTL